VAGECLRRVRHRRFKSAITSKFPRQKLANDGTKFASGQAIITPSIAKAEIISEYKQAEYLGMVENSDQFIANLIVRRNSINPNRLDVVYPPDIINQLRQFAVLSQFRLQYPNTLAAAAGP
jgi:phage tail sheath gpL-like